MAGGDTCLTAGACVQINFESVLFARSGAGNRQQIAIMGFQQRPGCRGMLLRKPFDGRQVLLFAQQLGHVIGTGSVLADRARSCGRAHAFLGTCLIVVGIGLMKTLPSSR